MSSYLIDGYPCCSRPIKKEILGSQKISKQPIEESFVDKAVRVAKEGQPGSLPQVKKDLQGLISSLKEPISKEQLSEIIHRVKQEVPHGSVLSPAIASALLSCLHSALTLGSKFPSSIQIASEIDLAQFDEDIRIECAKIDLSHNAQTFCENLKANKYGNLPHAVRKEFANSLQGEFGTSMIGFFDLDAETRKEMAFALTTHAYFLYHVQNFELEEADLLQIATAAINNGYAQQLAANIAKFGEANKNKIVRMLIQKDPITLFNKLDKFHISDKALLMEIAQIAFKKDPSLAVKAASLGLKDMKNIVALMAAVSHAPENLKHFDFVFSVKESREAILSQYPEVAYWLYQEKNENPEELFESICRETSPIPLKYRALFKAMQEEQEPFKKAEKTRHFILTSIALTYMKQSPELAKTLLSLIDELQKPLAKKDNPKVREQKNQWLANFLFQCRTKNISGELVLKAMPMIQAVLDLKAPFLRTSLQENLTAFFTNPTALENYAHCQKTMLELSKTAKIVIPKGAKMNQEEQQRFILSEQQKLAIKKEEKITTLLMMLAPYLSKESMGKVTGLLFGNKTFIDDEVRMKLLLSNMQVILQEPHLTDQEKARLCNQVIFVGNPSKSVKEQADTIIESADYVMQYVDFHEFELLKTITTPQGLRDNVKKMFIEQLGFEGLGSDFDAHYAATFLKARKPLALLTYAANMKRLPKEESQGVFKSIRAFGHSILTKTFDKLRNSPEKSLHIKTVEETAPRALEVMNKEFTHGSAKLTCDQWLLFLAGYDTHTCQSFAAFGVEFSRGMIATVIKGEVFQMVVTRKVMNKKGEEEEIVAAKSSLRLLLDKNTKRPVLYRGDTHAQDELEIMEHIEDINAACIALSDKLSKALGYSVPLVGPTGNSPYPGKIVCLPCKDIEFEYVEGADQGLPGGIPIVQGDQGYSIKDNHAKIIYDPATTK